LLFLLTGIVIVSDHLVIHVPADLVLSWCWGTEKMLQTYCFSSLFFILICFEAGQFSIFLLVSCDLDLCHKKNYDGCGCVIVSDVGLRLGPAGVVGVGTLFMLALVKDML
jgi:hypothetical protein